ncbi:MAG: hypothetical protein GY946_22360 [bacterium]|nr:hypothetical protein [bacterium]
MLIREAGDTGGEAFEAALEEHLGIKSDLFGSENTALLEKIAAQGATLFDLDNPEGDKLAQQLVDLAGRVSTMAERAVEKRAQGDVKKTLEDFGYVVGTVAGVEEVAFAAAAKSARVLGGLWKATDTVEDAATATAKATEGARSATGGTKLDAPAAATPAKAPDYAASAGKLRGDDLTVTLETPPKIRDGAPDNPVIKIKRSDGQQLILREVVGEGSTTKVYKVEGREDIVVKLTRSEGAAGKLDDAGHAVVRKVDPDGSAIQVPERYQQHSINDPGGPYEGGKLEVVQKAPDDFKKATGTHAKGGGMTKGQKAAYRKGLEKLNENGFVFLDNKADNFAFKLKEGTTDEWVMVVVDPGSIVPMKNLDADAARKLQRAIDTPSDEALGMDRWHSDDHGEMTGRRVHQEWLASEFDHLIDWDAINELAGTYYKTLGEGFSSQVTRLKGEIFPFNPNNGAKFKDIAVSGKAPERPRTTGGDGEAPGGPKDGKPPPTQSVREAAAELTGKGPDYTGTKRVPGTRDHGGGDGGGSGEGNLISVGGSFDGVTPVPTIYIAFGPGSYEDYTGIATDCSPCQDFVDSYLALLETRPMTPAITAQLAAIKSALPACEAFRCPKSAWDGDDSGVHVELLRMNSVFGNSPFSGVDPLNVLEGTAQLIFVLNVNGQFVPTNRFNSSAGPESGCNANHYHLSNAISTPVISCSGQSVSDPDSSGCGFGKVDSAIGIPRSDCENR